MKTMRWWFVTVLLGTAACGDADAGMDGCSDPELEVCQVFALVNEERAAAGLPAYTWNRELGISAQLHAEDMVDQSYFSHTSPDGRTFDQRMRDAGYDGGPRGENIALGQRSAEQVMGDWMDSDGHRRNILSSNSNEIGVGFLDNRWVQNFGFADRSGE